MTPLALCVVFCVVLLSLTQVRMPNEAPKASDRAVCAVEGVPVVGVTQQPKQPPTIEVFDSLRDDAMVCIAALPVNERGQRRCVTAGELRAWAFK